VRYRTKWFGRSTSSDRSRPSEAAAHARQLALRLTSPEDRELALRFAAELDAQDDALEPAAEAAWRTPVVQVQGQVQQQSGSSADNGDDNLPFWPA
jgi:hypothetical protein